MLTYLIRRILLIVPTLLGMTLLVFGVMAASPGGIGGPTLTEGGAQVTGASAQRIREYYDIRYGLDKPWYVQYGRWLNNLSPIGFNAYEASDPAVVEAKKVADGLPAKPDGKRPRPMVRQGDLRLTSPTFKMPDLGESITQRRKVSALLAETLPLTLLLNVLSLPIVYVIGITSGITAARKRGQAADIWIGTSQLAAWSVPPIWAGVLFIGFLANKEYLNWFPTGGILGVTAADATFLPSHDASGHWEAGYLFDLLWHLVLPVTCLTYGGSAFLSKLTRGSVLENLGADFVRTARAKGVTEGAVLYRHVFANSLLALITVAAAILPSLLGGAVIVETIFGVPGMGKLAVEAVNQRDREVVLAITFIGGVVGLGSTLLRDILYAVADPRVTYD